MLPVTSEVDESSSSSNSESTYDSDELVMSHAESLDVLIPDGKQ